MGPLTLIVMLLAWAVAGRRVRPTPIEAFLAEQRLADYRLDEEDRAHLLRLVTLPGSLESALQGTVLFNTHFLEDYDADPMLIVKNCVDRVQAEMLGVVRDVLGFFYDRDEELVDIGPAFFRPEWGERTVQDGIQELLEYWIRMTPGGASNASPLLAHLYRGPLGQEINQLLALLGPLVRTRYPAHQAAIAGAVEWARLKFDAFPEPLLTSLKQLRPVKITDVPANRTDPGDGRRLDRQDSQ